MRLVAPLRLCLAAALLFSALTAVAQVAVPPLKARVTDLTNTLNDQQRAALEQKLAAFEARKGSQIAVLLVATTQPEAIEQYSIRVVEAWKLGRKAIDDGVLFLIAKNDRKMRIEVGRGLEGAIPDVIAKRIGSDIVTPFFRQGDFYGGITAGVERIIKTVDGEPLPAPKPKPGTAFEDIESWLISGFILVFVVGGILRAILGRLGGSTVVAAVAGTIAWLIGGALIAGIIVGVIAFILSLFGGMAHAGVRSGGWSTGGGGFSSGGGGFSGGGGSFGGGGASSSW
jgi:uncharacterized protein